MSKAQWIGLAFAAALAACADAAPESAGDRAGENPDGCFRDADCPSGLSCVAAVCTAADGLPPEQEDSATFLRPASSGRYVFALSPDTDSMAIIDPVSLVIASVRLPSEPVGLQVVPGANRVVVLSRQGRAVTVASVGEESTSLLSVPTSRRFSALSLSPDGRWAALWTPDGETPDAGAEGIVALVDVQALTAGVAPKVVERAAGRRHTNVFFRTDGASAKDVVFVGKEEIAVVELDELEARPAPERVALSDEYAEILTREAVSPPGGEFVLLRSLATPELGVFDVRTRTFSTLALPGVASDLDLTPDGSRAVAVLRERFQVAHFSLPAADDLALIDTALPGSDCPPSESPCLVAPGQAVLSPDGKKAVLFSNARRSEAFGRVDFDTGEFHVFSRLQKLVRTIGLSPDGAHAIVLHRPEPGSTVSDTYERTVDRSEGYSVVDLAAGVAQLKLTQSVPPQEFVWAEDSRYAAVTLRNDAGRDWRVDAVDLSTLVVTSLALASAPQYAGPLPGLAADPRVWITQAHPAGRISFVDLAAHSVRTATGYQLNSEIE